jgi:hypothetical protein
MGAEKMRPKLDLKRIGQEKEACRCGSYMCTLPVKRVEAPVLTG